MKNSKGYDSQNPRKMSVLGVSDSDQMGRERMVLNRLTYLSQIVKDVVQRRLSETSTVSTYPDDPSPQAISFRISHDRMTISFSLLKSSELDSD